MKIKQKLVYGSIASALMLTTVLAGCSKADNNEASTENTQQNTAEQTNNTQSNTKEAEPAPRGSFTSSVYDRGNYPPEEGTVDNNRWTKWINENGPADVSYVPIPRFESQAKYNVLFASGSAPDLIFEYDTAYRNQLFNQKQLMPVDDMIEKYSTVYKELLTKFPSLKKLSTKSDGKMYEFGRVNGLQPNHVLMIRNDWLKKLNLQVPRTTDELFEVAKAFAEKDPDGNGNKDTYGMALSFISGMIVDYSFGNIFTIYEKYPWYPTADGQLVHDWDRTKAAVDFKKKLFDAGVVDKDFLTDSKGEKAKQDWTTGKLGIYGASGSWNDAATYDALKQADPNAEVMIIQLPKSPFGQFSPAIGNPVQMTAAVNATAKDPESIMKYVDFLVTPKTAETLAFGIEGTNYTLKDGCAVPTSDETNKLKVSGGDLMMLSQTNLDTFTKCNDISLIENPTQTQKDLFQLRTQAFEAYLSKDRPVAYLTHPEQMPALPVELQTVTTNAFKTILDIWQKAIISGSSYTTDQALTDAKAAWEQANGAQVDEWYSKWYAENKDKAFLTKDMYELMIK
ncbi:ABC transporter substrate-binding protein [Paenibacillus montanisoli]|uniref:ABC transporter substrate-binding protein n=2 Tax=Paenibacillus montanisoli TaxID=2081970 RepID=A0A328U1K0_9BACL|nr:ABC transporter substrate-binding protein [Paenibacillus montanisoli]